MKFTFKKNLPTGRYKSFLDTQVTIKLGRKEIGYYILSDEITVNLMVYKTPEELSKAPNCSWKWCKLKRTFSSEEEVREFLQSNLKKILNIKLYQFDPNK